MPTDPKEGTQFVRVDFACNDEHGNCTMKAERVNVEDLEIECTLLGGGIRLRDEKGFMWVGRRKFKHRGYKYGVGNWCWCAWWLAEADAVEVVNYLMRQKYWSCTSGPEVPFEKFARKEPFTIADLRDCL